MKKKSIILCVLLLAVSVIAACDKPSKQGSVDIGDTLEKRVIAEIAAEKKNEVITVGEKDEKFRLDGVEEDPSSSHVANEKFELDLDATVEDLSVYDPSETDIVGQFVSPSGKLYEMPAFWYADYDRSFEEYGVDQEYDISKDGTCFAQGNATIAGVIDEKDGEKTPVAKISFNVANTSAGGNGGAVISKSGITSDLDTLSVWLKAGENLSTTGLFLYLYGADDQAYVKLPTLTTEWKKYSFAYSDFTHAKPDSPLPISSMYSARIQTANGIPAGQTGAERYTAVGDVYISDMQFYWSEMPQKSVQIASFVGKVFKNYKGGDLFGKEIVEKGTEEYFKLRFRFTEAGDWTYRIVGKKNGAQKFRYASQVTVTENSDAEKNRGVVRVEPTKKRNFMFEDGTPYVPVGMNVCYSVDAVRGSYDYEVYFPKMKAAGMNFSRTWLTDIDAGYGAQNVAGGILNFDSRQDRLFRFDNIVELAEENGLYLQIPMQTISAFRKDVADGTSSHRWDTNPYNKINGGYLDEPWEYFTDARAIEDTKKLYRYYIARFGYSRNILNWELMNEIGMDSSWYFGIELTQEEARDWADEIGSYMHSADPYDHLVSISSGNDHTDKVYSAEAVDFVSFHWYYNKSDYATALANECSVMRERFGKPAMIGETGASGTSEAYNHDKDPYGMLNRQTAFTCAMGGGAAGAMTFWEECVNKYDQYANYTPAANMYKLMNKDFITYDMLTADNCTLSCAGSQTLRAYGYIGVDAVYAYVTDTAYNYSNLSPAAVTNFTAEFVGVGDGTFTVRVFDTQKGEVIDTFEVAANGGKLTVSAESWSKDIAFIIDKK